MRRGKSLIAATGPDEPENAAGSADGAFAIQAGVADWPPE
jgi:hypothetical protein